MNWKRILTGTLVATGVVFFGESIANQAYRLMLEHLSADLAARPFRQLGALSWLLMIVKSGIVGFLLMWLYAMVRPRLGPGPKTALSMASLIWLLYSVASAFADWLWWGAPGALVAGVLVVRLLACLVGAYLAGWQYIELAP